ncbi:hypothetical protein [Pseudoflavitalea rhizosphaerae]|uniref:hypothetical protein n=1 Tax=Pseudoflavitalea rhizosphaerae TaxID=1884793 RepID=UPI000F8DC185|nr:hypothetical protein [Pseudoflavitalea rhizosphaerae]
MKNNKRQLHRLILIMGLIISMISCKKNASTSETSIGEPVKSEKGEPAGAVVQQVIGPAGGNITSADGSLTIHVPAGAVATNTTFGIQPITNTIFEDTAKTAYRLTPEGTTFSTPVEISLNYSEGPSKSSNPQWIAAAYQTAEGNWKAVPGKLDKDRKKFIFKTNHFSDWSVTEVLSLWIADPFVGYGDTTTLIIEGFTIGNDDLLARLTNRVDNVEWRVIQPTKGIIKVDQKSPKTARFTPFRLQPNTSNIAEISVKLTGHNIKVFDETLPGGFAKFDQVTLLGQIEILGDSYMKGVFKGEKLNITNVSAIGNDASIGITGQQGTILINLHAFATVPGKYPCGEDYQYGKSKAGVSDYVGQIPKNYLTMYEDCGPPRTLKYSSGNVEITEFGKVGEPVKGSFYGPVYILEGSGPNGCPQYKSHMLYVEFRAIRSL